MFEEIVDPVDDSIFSYRTTALSRLNVPIPPSHESGLFSSIVETLKDVSRRINHADNDILQSYKNYIFDPKGCERFFSMKCASTKPEEIWRTYVLNQSLQQLVSVTLSIIPIVASEASVERLFSKQKGF